VVNADSVRLEQMIGNVLGNSIKFTPPRGRIRAAIDTSGRDAVVRVSDTGIGIPREQLDRVFDLFAQTPRALDRSHGGLGIGLTVVKLLAELHGGSAAITSGGEGMGTEVMIRLPLVEHEVTHDRTDEARQASASARRVLIIEDNLDVSEMLATYLQQIGHHVILAHDGHAGLEAALRHRPDVLICDIGLPGLDGYAIAARLRKEPDFNSCVMIAVTGYGDFADRERARRAGFVHHLTKPADPVNVAELIASTTKAAEAIETDVPRGELGSRPTAPERADRRRA
jgi:CheY-like chemotaxis protein